MRKEAAVASFKVALLSGILLVALRKTTKQLRITGLYTEVPN
jgi:hypothetical protein